MGTSSLLCTVFLFALVLGVTTQGCNKKHMEFILCTIRCQRTCQKMQKPSTSTCIKRIICCDCESGYIFDEIRKNCVPIGSCDRKITFQINDKTKSLDVYN